MSVSTIIGAIGLFALGVYQLTQGQFDMAIASISAGLAALGLHFNLANLQK